MMLDNKITQETMLCKKITKIKTSSGISVMAKSTVKYFLKNGLNNWQQQTVGLHRKKYLKIGKWAQHPIKDLKQRKVSAFRNKE